jgi:hypothetical protein
VLVRAKEKRRVERKGEFHGAVRAGEHRPNFGEQFLWHEGLPRRAEASNGCAMAKRCSWRGVVAGGELQ